MPGPDSAPSAPSVPLVRARRQSLSLYNPMAGSRLGGGALLVGDLLVRGSRRRMVRPARGWAGRSTCFLSYGAAGPPQCSGAFCRCVVRIVCRTDVSVRWRARIGPGWIFFRVAQLRLADARCDLGALLGDQTRSSFLRRARPELTVSLAPGVGAFGEGGRRQRGFRVDSREYKTTTGLALLRCLLGMSAALSRRGPPPSESSFGRYQGTPFHKVVEPFRVRRPPLIFPRPWCTFGASLFWSAEPLGG